MRCGEERATLSVILKGSYGTAQASLRVLCENNICAHISRVGVFPIYGKFPATTHREASNVGFHVQCIYLYDDVGFIQPEAPYANISARDP